MKCRCAGPGSGADNVRAPSEIPDLRHTASRCAASGMTPLGSWSADSLIPFPCSRPSPNIFPSPRSPRLPAVRLSSDRMERVRGTRTVQSSILVGRLCVPRLRRKLSYIVRLRTTASGRAGAFVGWSPARPLPRLTRSRYGPGLTPAGSFASSVTRMPRLRRAGSEPLKRWPTPLPLRLEAILRPLERRGIDCRIRWGKSWGISLIRNANINHPYAAKNNGLKIPHAEQIAMVNASQQKIPIFASAGRCSVDGASTERVRRIVLRHSADEAA